MNYGIKFTFNGHWLHIAWYTDKKTRDKDFLLVCKTTGEGIINFGDMAINMKNVTCIEKCEEKE